MNQETKVYIRAHASDDVRTLALRPCPPGVDLQQALQQIEGRQLAARKIPSWVQTDGLLWPPRLSLEQCSGDEAAAYKASVAERLKGDCDTLVDLTGGLGADFAAMARQFRHRTYVERNPALCRLAEHNLPLLDLADARVVCNEAENVLAEMPESSRAQTFILIDPARRDAAGRKTVLIEDCTPDVCALQERMRAVATHTLIKLSPMLDVTAALRAVHGVEEVHVVSGGGECKEVLLVIGQTTADPVIHCCGMQFTQGEERDAVPEYATALGTWLYEPDAAILKAGMVKSIGVRFGLRKLAPMSHLYTSDECVDAWPGKRFRVLGNSSFNKKALRTLLQGVTHADITVRGFPQSVATLRQRLHLREGGPIHIFATTLSDGQHVLIKAHPHS